jgi:hypothetical protein
MEPAMTSIIPLVAVVAGLVLMLHSTPSWGQPVCVAPGCNPTVSDGSSNTAGGTRVLQHLAGGAANTAFGKATLEDNTTGDSNTATGFQALQSNTTGTNNTASGAYVLQNSTTGTNNTASGAVALAENETGSFNTATGALALQTNRGNQNTATGYQSLWLNTAGNNNTATGVHALTSNHTGNLNTASGFQALQSNDAGNNNTAIGAKALKKSTGTKNIGIGFQAGVSLITGNNNIYIGNQGAGDEFQTIRIGTAQTQTFIAGINAAGVSEATVMVDTVTGQLGIVTSSARYKQDIAPMGTRSEKVLDLRPVTFAYKDDSKGTTHYGLIAEEVAAVYPELVTRTATGEVQTVKYQELIPMLLNELQRQRQDFQRELAELRSLVGQRRGIEASTSATAAHAAASTR